jgi:DNA-binding transcriptional MerR regulator
MVSLPARRGHAGIGAIIEDMEPYLPPETVDRPGYKQCRTTYGLLTTTYKRAETTDVPEKVYKELQQLEHDLRRRLQNLNASKGIPAKMTQFLDDLKAALDHAMAEGVDANFLIQGIADLLEEKPENQPAPKPERVRMVPDTKYKKVKAELAEAKKKIQKLNEENNNLVLYIKKLESER